MARVLVGVSGGIAAYKACELVRLLVKAGHDVVPLVTPGARRFVHAKTFAALARRPISEDPYPHLERAELLVVAPCTANTLAKLAHGLADNLITEAALAHRGQTLVAPAMNVRMWQHAATQRNVATLAGDGIRAADYLYAFANHAAPTLVWREEQSVTGSGHGQICGDMPHNY